MLPHVVVHVASSLDGRVTGFAPDLGLYYRLAGRWEEDAILVGADTLLAGEEQLDEAPPGEASPEAPLLVVTDSRGRIGFWPALRAQPYWHDVLVLVSEATPDTYIESLAEEGVNHFVAGDGRVDLRAALRELAEGRGVRTVRVDAGGSLIGVLLRAGLVDQVSVLVHPIVTGETDTTPLVRSSGFEVADQPIGLELSSVERLDEGVVWLRYSVTKATDGIE